MDIKQFEGMEETLKGYVEKASLSAPNMKQRSMTASFVLHKDADELLAELLGVPEAEVRLEEGRISFRRKLYEVIGNSYTGRKVARQLDSELTSALGKGRVLYEPEDPSKVCEALSGYSGGRGPFYIVEEVFLAQFDTVAAVFYVGNDE